jgi:hypothetical protein
MGRGKELRDQELDRQMDGEKRRWGIVYRS